MMERIETSRLVLRPLQDSDLVPLAQAVNALGIARNTARIPWPYTLDDALAFQRQQTFRHRASAFFVISAKSAGDEPVGGIGLEADHSGAAAEIGYWLAEPCWGRGFGFEAASAVCACAFRPRGFDRLHARYRHGNEASRRILDRLGFRLIGHGMGPSRAEGRATPVAWLELTKREWRGGGPLRTRGSRIS